MNVYIAKPNEAYSGGCVIVAANSINEAEKLAYDEVLFKNCLDIELMPELQTTHNEPGVIVSKTYFE